MEDAENLTFLRPEDPELKGEGFDTEIDGPLWTSVELGVIAADEPGLSAEDAENLTFLRPEPVEFEGKNFETAVDADLAVCWDRKGRGAVAWEAMKESKRASGANKVTVREQPIMEASELHFEEFAECSQDDASLGRGAGAWDRASKKFVEVARNVASGQPGTWAKIALRTPEKYMSRLVKLSASVSSQTDGTKMSQARLLSHLVRFAEALGRSQSDLDAICQPTEYHNVFVTGDETCVGVSLKVSRPPKDLPTQVEAADAWPPYPSFQEPPKTVAEELTPGLAGFDPEEMMAFLMTAVGRDEGPSKGILTMHTTYLSTAAGKEQMEKFLKSRAEDFFQDAPQADAEEEEETAALTDEAEEGEFPALSEEPKKKSVVAVEEIEIAVAPAAVEASSNNSEEPESNAIAPAKKAVGCSCAIM